MKNPDRRKLANRFKDAKDPFNIVLMRDMWLTGFDAPCLLFVPAAMTLPLRGDFSERFLKEWGWGVRSFPMRKFKSTRERRALAKARAEAKLRRWREAHEYAERVFLRMVKRLRVEREARGLTMYEVESASGLSREMVGRIETGRSVPSLIVLGKVARAFRVPLPKLLVALCARCRS